MAPCNCNEFEELRSIDILTKSEALDLLRAENAIKIHDRKLLIAALMVLAASIMPAQQ